MLFPKPDHSIHNNTIFIILNKMLNIKRIKTIYYDSDKKTYMTKAY